MKVKVLIPESSFSIRVNRVMRALRENRVLIKVVDGEILLSDLKPNAPEYRKNMKIYDNDFRPILSLSGGTNYKLVINEKTKV